MKTRVVTVAFFLAGVLLEMRNALPKNRLKGFPRGKLTVPWEHLPVLLEAAHRVNFKKQTTSNTEDMPGSNARAYYVAKLFHVMASRSTNQRPFLKEFKAQVPSKMQGVDYKGSVSARRRTKRSDGDNKRARNLTAVVVNASSIVLTWEKPRGVKRSSEINGYQITMNGPGNKSEYSIVTTMTSHTYRFLNFSTRYTFEVRTRFSKDNSLGPPVHVIKTTDPFTAPVRPMKARELRNGIALSWSAPRTVSAKAVKRYMVSWKCTGRCHGNGHQTFFGTNCTILNLRRGQRYLFSVNAVTDFGTGETSTISILISLYFAQVRNLRASIDDNYNMAITWDRPNNFDKDDIKYYVVQWCKSRINNLQYCYMDEEHSIHVSERNFTVDGVLASSTYKIIAYAVTADAGSGQKSIIPKTVPPLNLKVSYAYSYMSGARYGLQVYLSWNSVHASEPVRYELRWRCLYRYLCDYWHTRVVNSTFSLVNVRHYDTSYEFGITVLTPHGRGTPYQLSQFVPPINGMPRDFYCQVTADNTVLTCHWTPPTDFDPDAAEFNYYWLKYRCNECQTYSYKQIYRLSTTSTRISVSRGKRWTVMLQVRTRYGDGEWAKTTVVACSLVVMRPVTDLEARLDAHNKTLVSHLTWKAPHDIRNLQNYLVITECEGDCIASATRRVTLRPSLDLNLSCGNNYTFTVKIQSTCGTGPGSNISVSMKPPTGAVTNLTIRFIAGNSRMEDAFLLRWNLPKQTNTTSIEFCQITMWAKNTGQIAHIIRTDGNSSHRIIFRKNHVELFRQGQYYVFQVRCKTLCGYGPSNSGTGFYPEFTSSSSPFSPLPSTVVTYPTAASVKPTKSALYHSPSLAPPSSVITYPTAASTTLPAYSASVSPTESSLYHSLTAVLSYAVITYPTAGYRTTLPSYSASVTPTESPLYHSLTPVRSSAVITYPKAAYTTLPSYSASVAHAQSLLYLSPTSYATLAMVTCTSSTIKPFSASPQPARSHHKHKRFPYWAIATTAAVGAIVVSLVVYIVRKRCKKGRRSMLNFLQADYSQDIQENIDEENMPLLLENFTDDDTGLIQA